MHYLARFFATFLQDFEFFDYQGSYKFLVVKRLQSNIFCQESHYNFVDLSQIDPRELGTFSTCFERNLEWRERWIKCIPGSASFCMLVKLPLAAQLGREFFPSPWYKQPPFGTISVWRTWISFRLRVQNAGKQYSYDLHCGSYWQAVAHFSSDLAKMVMILSTGLITKLGR